MPGPDETGAAGAGEHVLVRRVAAAQATLDRWSAERWRMGYADCVRMAASHLRLLGHPVRLPPAGSYRTVAGAVKALAARGHASLADAIDAEKLERIAPARAIVGDLLLMPAEHELGALVVCMGNNRVAGWHDEHPDGAVVMQPLETLAAWRVEPA